MAEVFPSSQHTGEMAAITESVPFAEISPRSPEDEELSILDVYLQGIARVPLLRAEEEVALAQTIEVGLTAEHRLETGGYDAADERYLRIIAAEGAAAKKQFVEANLQLSVFFAKRYWGRGVPLLDLIQEGNIGVIHAVERFDYTQGYKFSTYAAPWIRKFVRDALEEPHDVSLDAPINEEGGTISDVIDDFRSGNGSTDDPAELVIQNQEMPSGAFDDTEGLVLRLIDAACSGKGNAARRRRWVKVVRLHLGLVDGKRWSHREIAQEMGVTYQAVSYAVNSMLAEMQALAPRLDEFRR